MNKISLKKSLKGIISTLKRKNCFSKVKNINSKDAKNNNVRKMYQNKVNNLNYIILLYDVRYLSSEGLKNIYHNKVLGLSSYEILKSFLEDLSSVSRWQEFQSFIDNVSKDKSYYQNIAIAGFLNYEVFSFLKNLSNEPKNIHISIRKGDLLHLYRDSKQNRGTALSIEEVKNIPLYLQNSHQILYDTQDPAILYIFNKDDKVNKIVVRVNHKYKVNIFNFVTTATKVSNIDIQQGIKSRIYEVIK